MEFPRKKDAAAATTKQAGDAAEDRALAHLVASGLRLLARNYRTPGRGGGEIDLVMRAADGTVVFVEVRKRASRSLAEPRPAWAMSSSGASSSRPAIT